MPQEAIIGIVYVVASALAILVANRTPRGGEAINDILVGSLLWVTWPMIGRLAAIYALIGLFHWLLRHRCLTISFHPEIAWAQGWDVRWWDPLFYLLLGIVITFSVPIAGVLLVLSFLVVPAAVASQFTRRQAAVAVISRGCAGGHSARAGGCRAWVMVTSRAMRVLPAARRADCTSVDRGGESHGVDCTLVQRRHSPPAGTLRAN